MGAEDLKLDVSGPFVRRNHLSIWEGIAVTVSRLLQPLLVFTSGI